MEYKEVYNSEEIDALIFFLFIYCMYTKGWSIAR